MAKWASALLLWSQLKAQFIAPPLFRLKADTRAGCKAGGQGWWQLGAAGGSWWQLVAKLVTKLVAAFLYAAAAAALVQMLGCYHSAVKTIEVYVNHI